ncbi:MAG: hypothetical protein GF349_04780 [Candidatus Magasanikbacteria bacterium]|nr:hypothetical protein [Candidatus Magasanikbacteria bacterium]
MNQKNKKKPLSINRVKTGIEGLDEVLSGGFPAGRSLLVSGEAGAGKTVFLSEFLYHGITKYKENGVFVTFEEQLQKS